tara:strand:+ start:4084 stop:6003 length:1920 start_codon:yes stop_codon:yes gene_type:complete
LNKLALKKIQQLMNKLFPLLITSLLFSQINVKNQRMNNIQDALFMERKGELENAKIIYEKLLDQNPTNRQAYQRLKDIFKRTEELFKATDLINSWIKSHPNDLQAHIELGEILYLNNDKINANKVWEEFENNYGKNQSAYRMLLHTYSRLSLTQKMIELVYRGRKRLNKIDLLSLDLANYFYSRQTFDLSLDELLVYIKSNPTHDKLVMDKILLISDDPENNLLIEKKLVSNLEEGHFRIHKLLAGFYFKTEKYKDAYEVHLSMGLQNNTDYKRWLNLAENLRKENQYRLSIDTYQELLNIKSNLTPSIIGDALLGLGKTYEDQLLENNYQNRLVNFYPDNIFFINQVPEFPNDTLRNIESTFNLYQQILKELPASTFSSKAHYRLGELQLNVMQDFVGARSSYFSALKSKPGKDLRNNIILKIGDTYLAEGNLKNAMYHNEQYYQKNNSINNINSLTMKKIHLTFLSGEIDTTKILIDSLIANTSPKDKYFNDLMELQGIISQHFLYGNKNDKNAFLFYVKAEKYLQEFKFIEAAEMLSYLRNKYPNASIVPIAILRECLLRMVVDDASISLNIAKLLQNTSLAAEGIAAQGEIYEKSFKNTKKAIEMYNLLIEDYPMSMLAEPVRIRIRKLNTINKS